MARRKTSSDDDLWLLGIGGVIWYLSRSSGAQAAPALPTPAPSPAAPPAPSPGAIMPTEPPQAPAPTPPAPEPEPIVNWAPGNRIVNSIPGYHRAKTSELGPEIKRRAQGFLIFNVGTVKFVDADGKHYAVALEDHNNHPEIGPTNKGVSIFVRNK